MDRHLNCAKCAGAWSSALGYVTHACVDAVIYLRDADRVRSILTRASIPFTPIKASKIVKVAPHNQWQASILRALCVEGYAIDPKE